MIKSETLNFLEKLSVNNNKPWFDEHRDVYAIAKADFEGFIATLLEQLYFLEPMLQGQQAKDCVYRIFRDVRFSKDKTPYKSHFGAYFSKGGRKYEGAGYYLHIQPGGKSFIGGGLWMPESPLLKKVRQEIDYNLDEFETILKNKDFKKLFNKIDGEQLKTLPKGYTPDNPAAEYLKLKSFTAGRELADKEVTAKNFISKCVSHFTAINPLINFLNRVMD